MTKYLYTNYGTQKMCSQQQLLTVAMAEDHSEWEGGLAIQKRLHTRLADRTAAVAPTTPSIRYLTKRTPNLSKKKTLEG